MTTIQLTDGKVAIVDEADYSRLARYTWGATETAPGYWYAYSSEARRETGHFYMHRFLTDAPKGMVVDHINGDRLDNRRANLRVCKHWQNLANNEQAIGESGYRGVIKARSGRFTARLKRNGKNLYFGTFDTPEEAARARDKAARELHGEFAVLNFP